MKIKLPFCFHNYIIKSKYLKTVKSKLYLRTEYQCSKCGKIKYDEEIRLR